MDEVIFGPGSVPVAVAARVFGKDACWVRAGIITGCGKLDRISNYADDMTEKEINDEHNRAIDELISFDFLNIYKKVPRNSKVALDLGAAPV